jgi:signal transduction histidine kinase
LVLNDIQWVDVFRERQHEAAQVHLKLISADRDLQKACREILSEVFGQTAVLSLLEPEDYIPGPELCLWDYRPGLTFPAFPFLPNATSRQLFVVHKDDLTDFYEKLGTRHAAVLLRPVSRPTLTAFLSFAAADRQGSDSLLRADRDDILQGLIQTNLRLQEYDQYRTNFLARAVHDFRAPLTALCGYCDFLLAEPLGPLSDQQKEVLRRMLHSTKRLSRMATSMFQLSVGRQVKPRLDLRKGDLRDCVEQALHEISPFAEEKRIAIDIDLVSAADSLYFEAEKIEQLLINLLDNACKFTPKAGSIDIRGYPFFWERRRQSGIPIPKERRQTESRAANSYRVDVHDSGALIPAERLGLIFEEYVAYPASERSSTGLGLAICRAIVAQHDGHIWADNTPSGPTFSFVLPFHSRRPFTNEIKETAFSEVA